MPTATTAIRRHCRYTEPCFTTSGSLFSAAKIDGAARMRITDSGSPIATDSRMPPLSGTAASSILPSPTRRAAIAWTAGENPVMNATAMKLRKLASPVPASAAGPNPPTIHASTRLSRFCDVMPPMIGSDSRQISRARLRSTSPPRMGALARPRRLLLFHLVDGRGSHRERLAPEAPREPRRQMPLVELQQRDLRESTRRLTGPGFRDRSVAFLRLDPESRKLFLRG